ncbi:hypothetical protein [Ornithinibacillus contaminans]|uniref:hypothetical protein n=1 Tax=Ornithinibacillus contaminans TaxID=694055 RepID=UPI00064D9524|nr:hypothetical protein [Ornithinibacillus contaminans]
MPIAPCPTYGVHRMVMQGSIVVKDDDTNATISNLSNYYRCTCGERVISEGMAHYNVPLRDYVTEGGIQGTTIISGKTNAFVERDLIYYTSQTSIDGYRFYSA